MKVLLSIKPEFAEKIFNGTKKYEFRRSIFKNTDVKTVVVYVSSPTQQVIGEFKIGAILCDAIDSLWSRTRKHAGINKKSFFEYFSDKQHGYAITIKEVRTYSKPLSLKKDFNVLPPQSFVYLS